MRVWLLFLGSTGNIRESDLVHSLAQEGIDASLLNSELLPGPGVLFFGEVAPRLFEVVQEVSRNGVDRVLAIGTSRTALPHSSDWRLLKSEASDVLVWDRFADPVAEVVVRLKRWESIDTLVHSPLVRDNLVGKSPAWVSVLRQIVEGARFTDASVLLVGETGTGKELVARLIHTLDQRPQKGELVVLDCTTIVPELSGSEFFGHERGAFTGAIASRDGAFALADGSTLFLDEVGELSLGLQAHLLRVIEEGMYKRVGGNTWQRTHFRLVCATNRDLLQEVMQGKFRRDLYYRIATTSCKLPPIRDRTEDILPLVHHFMRSIQPSQEPLHLDEPICAYLLKREYPGNVRELKQLVTRVMYRHVGYGPITVGDLPAEERPDEELEPQDWCDTAFETALRRAIHLGIGLKEIRRKVTETAIRIGVGDEEGNLQRAALKLKVTSRALQILRAARRQREHNPDVGDEAS
ncbi:MAG: sigma 54-interacting transcriptional regulator [Thermodesulfobacteriota bacterium]